MQCLGGLTQTLGHLVKFLGQLIKNNIKQPKQNTNLTKHIINQPKHFTKLTKRMAAPLKPKLYFEFKTKTSIITHLSPNKK